MCIGTRQETYSGEVGVVVMGKGGTLVHLKALRGSQGAARLSASLSLFFNKSQKFRCKPFGW